MLFRFTRHFLFCWFVFFSSLLLLLCVCYFFRLNVIYWAVSTNWLWNKIDWSFDDGFYWPVLSIEQQNSFFSFLFFIFFFLFTPHRFYSSIFPVYLIKLIFSHSTATNYIKYFIHRLSLCSPFILSRLRYKHIILFPKLHWSNCLRNGKVTLTIGRDFVGLPINWMRIIWLWFWFRAMSIVLS